MERERMSFMQECRLVEAAVVHSRVKAEDTTLETDILADNLYSIHNDFEGNWYKLSAREKERWVKLAEYVLDREAMVTAAKGYRRAMKRQLERLTLRRKKVK